ncbi:MAG: response regulator transcription factor [Bacteroidia bacterium]|nr:response regulator transcription factor [Bacteroidia bacterium]
MSETLTTLIVDDELDAVNFIRSIITEYCPKLEIIGTANSAEMGADAIREMKPELLFLDVEMPHGSGFDLLSQFPEKSFDVIFITAFNHYAIQAIKFSAVDYILKPININEFIQAVDKVFEKRNDAIDRHGRYTALLENIRKNPPTRLAIPTSDGLEFLDTDEIIRIEADRSYCWFHLTNNRKILVSKNLKEFQELLNNRNFFRPHNSHLVNLEHVKKYIRHDGNSAIMADGSQIPISRNNRDLFLAMMGKLSR